VSPRRILIFVLFAAAILRAAWSVTVRPAAFLEIDGTEYRDIAQNLSAGRGYAVSVPRWFEPAALLPPGPHADFARPPLLPVLGAALFRLPGSWEAWARACMVALGTLTVWLMFGAGERLFNRPTGLIAAGIFALHPYAIYYSGRWSTETPFMVAVLGAVVVLAGWGATESREPRADIPRSALAGLLTGLAALARPTGLMLIPAFALWILLRRRSLARAAVFLAAVGLTLAPWTLRNHAATDRWNPGTFIGPYNLWAGMHDRILAMYHGADTPLYTAEVEALFHEDSQAAVREMEVRGIVGPVAEGRYWSDAARAWVSQYPRRAAEILARRTFHYFQMTPETSVMSRSAQVAALYLWPVHLLALLALWSHRRRVPRLPLAPPLVGLLVSLPFIFSLRYRFPFLDPYAALFAAAAVSEIPDRVRRHFGGPPSGRVGTP
jgi:4-amino-4-deoxy-L-arabinose transferase-like glycosyltransferase